MHEIVAVHVFYCLLISLLFDLQSPGITTLLPSTSFNGAARSLLAVL
jgi:hypothetical protein